MRNINGFDRRTQLAPKRRLRINFKPHTRPVFINKTNTLTSSVSFSPEVLNIFSILRYCELRKSHESERLEWN